MSYYYSYYVGYEHEGKIYPLGPYDCFGVLRPAVERSRSFASDLHELFSDVKEENISEELRKEFEWEDWDGKKRFNVKVCRIEDLPTDSFIKSGYFLIEDVKSYEMGNTGAWEIFYDRLSPQVYVAMLMNEMCLGKPEPVKDDFEEEYQPKSASDYMFFAYPDYYSKEYEASLIISVADGLESYGKMPQGAKLVALETEG